MIETEHFINTGYGWVCKHCSPPENLRSLDDEQGARYMREGEAEEKEPVLSTTALARWLDSTRRTLVCPRCSIEEPVEKA